MGVATLSVRLQFGRASRAPHAVRIAIIENLAKALELALLVGVVVFFFRWSPIRAEGNAPPGASPPFSNGGDSRRPSIVPNFSYVVGNTRQPISKRFSK